MKPLEKNIKIVIDSNGGIANYWRDIWLYRELFGFLAWKDIIVRYKQTTIGIAWSVLRPIISMVLLTFVFGYIAKVDSKGIPFPIMVYSGLLSWNFFANSFTEASNSLIVNTNLLTKVYFPRLIIPTSTVVVNLIDLAISSMIFIAMMIYFQIPLRIEMLWIPVFFLITFITSLGAGYFVAALNVRFRDFKYVVPFVTQIGNYITPVGYLSTTIGGALLVYGVRVPYRALMYLNPMTATIDGFRWAMFGGENTVYIYGLIASAVVAVTVLILGVWYFRKMELSFADVV
jgi:lipopolysaccharide transport system permease protein